MDSSFLSLELASKLINEFGLPLYVYSEESIVNQCNKILNAASLFEDANFYYAAKANSNPSIIRSVYETGFGLEIVSIGEAKLALKMNLDPSRLFFSPVFASEEDIAFSVNNKILLNIGDVNTLHRYALYVKENRITDRKISLRFNLGFGAGFNEKVITAGENSKFGIYEDIIPKVLSFCKENEIRIIGAHNHIGSNIIDDTELRNSVNSLCNAVEKYNIDVDFINIGGGFGIDYSNPENQFYLNSLFKFALEKVSNLSSKMNRKISFRAEPGRFIVANSGILLVKVRSAKQTSKKQFLVTNAGMNTFIRTAMYGAKHRIVNLSAKKVEGEGVKDNIFTYDVVGNICESGDIFGSDVKLPESKDGDLLAILDVGAYGYSMGSNYNLQPLPAECMIDSTGKIKLIRKAQNIDDIINNYLA